MVVPEAGTDIDTARVLITAKPQQLRWTREETGKLRVITHLWAQLHTVLADPRCNKEDVLSNAWGRGRGWRGTLESWFAACLFWFLILCFCRILLCFLFLVLFLTCFWIKDKEKNINLGDSGCGEDLGGAEEGKGWLKIYCINYFYNKILLTLR